jgi:hypothetical protein
MGFLNWLQINWGNLVSSIGAAGLIFTAVALHREANARRVGNQFELTKQHREIWTQLYVQPELKRILDPAADLRQRPVTVEERLFVTLLILHLASAYRARRFGMVLSPEELRADISSFFGLPIPRAVWEQSQKFQDRDFVAFVENYRTP